MPSPSDKTPAVVPDTRQGKSERPQEHGQQREQASDEYGAHSEHQQDIAGEERNAGIPRETPEDQRNTQSGGRTGNS
jgi:hypothetical protein